MRRIRTWGIGAATAALVASGVMIAPSADALSGGVSTTWGKFYCSSAYNTAVKTSWADTRDTLHYRCTVTDKARDGYGVYLQVNGYRAALPDTGWKRLTPNAGGYGHSRTFSGTYSANTLSGWKLRVCKSIVNRADVCSGYLFVPD